MRGASNEPVRLRRHAAKVVRGKLVLPESLRPYMPNKEAVIPHEWHVFVDSLRPDMGADEIDKDPRNANL
jgi:hypothetical protein